MPNLNVRKLDSVIYEQLRLLAAKEGISMEEEARRIIARAVSTPERLSDVFKEYFGYKNGIDLELPRHPPHDPMDFNE